MRKIVPAFAIVAIVVSLLLLTLWQQPPPEIGGSLGQGNTHADDQPSNSTQPVSAVTVSPENAHASFVPGQVLARIPRDMSPADRDRLLSTMNLTILDSPARNVFRLALPDGAQVQQVAGVLDRNGITAEPNFYVHSDKIPNDPDFGAQWALQSSNSPHSVNTDIGVTDYWDLTIGSRDIVIGIADSGIRYDHPDIATNLWANPGEIAGNGVDDDNNGWVDDVYGIDAISANGDPIDIDGHGTFVAGVIAAQGDNSIGISGVMWEASIASCRFLDATGYGELADALTCLEYFMDQRDAGIPISIVNASWGNEEYSMLLSSAIDAMQQRDMLLVASAGNESKDTDTSPHYPSGYPQTNIIAVAAHDDRGRLTSFSNYGATTIDIAAPGESILGLGLSGYIYSSGTSAAAPFVSGLLGLLKLSNPGADGATLVAELLNTSAKLPELDARIRTGSRARILVAPNDDDDDGMLDAWERLNGLDSTNPLDKELDLDSDLLSNIEEYRRGTNPGDSDTDDDGLPDGDEVLRGTDPLLADSDSDGLSDGQEVNLYESDPLRVDTDGDGINDTDEIRHGTNPNAADSDGDGMSDAFEINYGLDPTVAGDETGDIDNDGVSNGEEAKAGSNPTLSDTDGDGLSDFDEVKALGTNPNLVDSDADGVPDAWEVAYSFDPLNPDDALLDNDADGYRNIEEYGGRSDPFDNTSVPALAPWSQHGGDSGRTFYRSVATSPEKISLRWESLVVDYQSYPVLIKDGQMFLRPNEKLLVAVDLAFGTELWRQELSNPAYLALVGATGLELYNRYQKVYERRSFVDGELLAVPAATEINPEEVIAFQGDLFYFTSYSIGRISETDSALNWDVRLASGPYYGIGVDHLVSRENIVIVTAEEALFFDPQNGAELFRLNIEPCGRPRRSSLDTNGDVYVSFEDGCVIRIDNAKREIAWRKDVQVIPIHAIGPELVFVRNDAYAANGFHGVIALDKTSGDERWRLDDENIGDGEIVSTSSHVFYHSFGGLKAINVDSGVVEWSYPVPNSGQLAISDDGALVFVSLYGRVFVFNLDADADQDGLPDWFERRYFGQVLGAEVSADPDGDGLTNLQELENHTNPALYDTDRDQLSDAEEIRNYQTDPQNADTDGDGLSDGTEIGLGSSPHRRDSDNDGVSDARESTYYMTNPVDADSKPELIYHFKESFESATYSGVDLIGNWRRVGNASSDGRFSMMGVGSYLTADVTGVFAEGTFTFDSRMVGQNGSNASNPVEVFIDGKRVSSAPIEGADWPSRAYAITEGEHTISIRCQECNGQKFLLDNLTFHKRTPIGTRSDTIIALVNSGIAEFRRDGNLAQAPILGDFLIQPRTLMQLEDKNFVLAGYNGFIFFDPLNRSFKEKLANLSHAVKLATDGRLLYAMGPYTLRVFDGSGNHLYTVDTRFDYTSIAASASGRLFAKYADSVRELDPATATELAVVQVDRGSEILAVTADDHLLLSESGRLLETDMGGTIYSQLPFLRTSITYANRESLIASATSDNTFLFDLSTGQRSIVPVKIDGMFPDRGGADTDGDGMPDWWETWFLLDAQNPGDQLLDGDDDGANNLLEFLHGTLPDVFDTDGDGLSDGDEIRQYGTNPLLADGDGDGLPDPEELELGTDGKAIDSDGDGLTDRQELQLGLLPGYSDSDGDGIPDGWEVDHQLDPLNRHDGQQDADGDGLDAYTEFILGSDDHKLDSDQDGLSDAEEMALGLDIAHPDSDNDDIPDYWELIYGLDPTLKNDDTLDSDGDGFTDREEYFADTHPMNSAMVPGAGDWIGTAGNRWRTSAVPIKINPRNIELVWEQRDLQANNRPLMSTGGRIFNVGYNRLYCLESRSGQALWQREFGYIHDATVAYGRVYVLDSSSDVYVLSEASGELLAIWRVPFPQGRSMVATQGNLILNAHNAIDALSGETRWAFGPLAYPTEPVLSFDAQRAYFSSRFGVEAKRIADGRGALVKLLDSLKHPIVLANRQNILARSTTSIALIDAHTGTTQWSRKGNFSTPAVHRDVVYVSSLSSDTIVQALDLKTGDPIWSRRFPGQSLDSPGIIATTTHLFASIGGKTIAVSLADRDIDWSTDRVGELSIGEDRLLRIANDDAIVAYRLFMDLDNDFLPDDWENANRLDSTNAEDSGADPDGDGLTNLDEFYNRTLPYLKDSDGDGISDQEEIAVHYSSPANPDTDMDGLLDDDEILGNTSIIRFDTDHDGLSDSEELFYGTSPALTDTDSDGLADRFEVEAALDPLSYNTIPEYSDYFESFESGRWEEGWSSQGWRLVRSATRYGNFVAQTAPIEPGETITLSWRGKTEDAQVRFNYRCDLQGPSSPQIFLYGDNAAVGVFQHSSGNWIEGSYDLGPGSHVLEWTFQRNDDEDARSSHCSIDGFSISPRDTVRTFPVLDSDNDGQVDTDELACGSVPSSFTSVAPDFDHDGLPDCIDPDDDNDQIPDTVETTLGYSTFSDNCQTDQDGDGFSDCYEYIAGTIPTNPNSPAPAEPIQDFDNDGVPDALDRDDDNDGVIDIQDEFPLDATETTDTDGDGIGNHADADDDNDGVPDIEDTAPLNANVPVTARLRNLATRGIVGTGDEVLIGGLVITGNEPKSVVIRARGPALADAGVSGVLLNPQIALFSGSTVIDTNDDWQNHAGVDLIPDDLKPANYPAEAVIARTLAPGPYTAIVSGVNDESGIGLVEIFEVDDTGETRLLNIATRGQVGTGDNVLIGGLVISGTTSKKIVIRAKGPSLLDQGVANVLMDPQLSIFKGSEVIATNDDWQTDINFEQIPTDLRPTNNREATLYLELAPGPYTAIMSGVGETTGIGLIEVFEVLQ
ncbi:MAG: S8 family serine peptidase [Pseudomonadota bacterium]